MVWPGLLTCWGNSGRALSDASHTGHTANSLLKVSVMVQWTNSVVVKVKEARGLFYLHLTSLNPLEYGFGHIKQMYWLRAYPCSEALSQQGVKQERRWILFYAVCIRDLHSPGHDVLQENAKMRICSSAKLTTLHLVMSQNKHRTGNRKACTPVLNWQVTPESWVAT